ncbi:MAG: ABC transporter permease subunit [Pirellulales bacterium]|nr:ABC transporter permease subunit [Pirellulales bacterium]
MLAPPVLIGVSSVWLTPIWLVGVGAAICGAALFAFYMLLKLTAPRLAAIALTTSKEAIAQPLFWVLIFVGIAALLAFPFVPYNTFGEDVKVVKDSGLTLIMVLAIVLALWTASISIADEIEGRTALTLLSKPVRRWQFIVGKFLGILGPVAIMFIVLGTLFLTSVSYKVVYDAREGALPEPTTWQCRAEMLQIVPGLVLGFLEVVVLTSISVAISTRLPMLANLLICSSIYVLGHLVPMLVNSSVGQFPLVQFMGYFIATILPVLDHFNVQAAVATGAQVPWSYLAWTLLYTVLYSTVALFVALIMFDDRDLA